MTDIKAYRRCAEWVKEDLQALLCQEPWLDFHDVGEIVQFLAVALKEIKGGHINVALQQWPEVVYRLHWVMFAMQATGRPDLQERLSLSMERLQVAGSLQDCRHF